MNTIMITANAREYWCFISYRHADNREMGRMWASWLHQRLENYEVPDELVGQKNDRGDTIPERIFPVFRDEDELPANADLGSPIYGALDQSKLLLVLCSPRARQSLYVNNEIAYFKRIGKSDRVIAALIDGVPNSSWNGGSEETECFPVALMHPVDDAGNLQLGERAEPIAADFRLKDETEGWTSLEAYRQELERQRIPKKQIQQLVQQYQKSCDLAFLKIVAGVIGVPLGTLTDRDTKYQLEKARRRAKILRRVAFSMGLLTLMAIAAGCVAWVQWQEARQRKEEALSNLETSRENEYLSGIRYARAALGDERHDLARATLLSLPKDRRSLEWGMFMEWAGPPALQFDSALDPGKHYVGSPEVKSELSEMWQQLLKKKEGNTSENGVEQSVSPSGNVAANYPIGTTRSGSYVNVYRRDLAEPIMNIATESYGGVGGVIFSKDGSLMMVRMDKIRGVVPDQLGPMRETTGDEEAASLFYILPVSKKICLPEELFKNIDNPSSYDWNDLDLEARAWKEDGVVISSEYLPVVELTWDGSLQDGQNSEAGHRSLNLSKRLGDASEKVMKKYSGDEFNLGMSAVWEDPQGRVLALVNKSVDAQAGDVWELTSGKKLMGFGESSDTNFGFRDWGGAFSSDGQFVIMAPVKAMEGHMTKDEDGMRQVEAAVAIYRMKDGSLVSYLENTEAFWTERGPNAKFSFSPDSKHVTYSSYDGSVISNIIHVYETETGKRIENEGGVLGYYGWTPDGQYIASAELDSGVLDLVSIKDKSKVFRLQGAVSLTASPVHHQLETAISETHDRYRMGRYLFRKGEAVPLVEMEFLATTNDLEKWLLRTDAREVVLLRGNLERSLRNNAPSNLNSAELMLYDYVSRLDQKN